jgi:RNA polymerase sigma factor (sigma-70 family)
MERNHFGRHWIYELDCERDRRLAALLKEAQLGNRDAYATFLTETAGLLRDYLGRRIDDPETVEDVLQDILITVHRIRHTYLPSRPVGPWLYAISDHRLSDANRRLRRIEKNEVAMTERTSVVIDPTSSQPSNERGELIRSALAGLPKRQRSVIEMLKVQNMSVREIAALTGMSESWVKVTAYRGYETLRKLLGVHPK